MCDDLELKTRDLQSKLPRTSAQLAIATAREGHCGDDPSSSRSLGGRQVEGERTQNGPSCRQGPPYIEARRYPYNPSSEAYVSDDRLRRIMRDRGYCIPSGFACSYCNGQLDELANCSNCGDHGECFACGGKLDSASGNCGNCGCYRGLPKPPNVRW